MPHYLNGKESDIFEYRKELLIGLLSMKQE